MTESALPLTRVFSRFKPYPAYKDSGVAWLERVPSGWEQTRRRAVISRLRDEGRPELPLLTVSRDRGVVLRSATIDKMRAASEDLGAYQIVSSGNLVVNRLSAWDGALGVSWHEGI